MIIDLSTLTQPMHDRLLLLLFVLRFFEAQLYYLYIINLRANDIVFVF